MFRAAALIAFAAKAVCSRSPESKAYTTQNRHSNADSAAAAAKLVLNSRVASQIALKVPKEAGSKRVAQVMFALPHDSHISAFVHSFDVLWQMLAHPGSCPVTALAQQVLVSVGTAMADDHPKTSACQGDVVGVRRRNGNWVELTQDTALTRMQDWVWHHLTCKCVLHLRTCCWSYVLLHLHR